MLQLFAPCFCLCLRRLPTLTVIVDDKIITISRRRRLIMSLTGIVLCTTVSQVLSFGLSVCLSLCLLSSDYFCVFFLTSGHADNANECDKADDEGGRMRVYTHTCSGFEVGVQHM